ncbi:lymphocyte antigen 75-like [Halichoeres trimaculatus]|uniref:lymphocyte antigen 75-like n=1 Tax=Halichoeres trimaculatus TaxID=147232 RepID=UPI003D9E8275
MEKVLWGVIALSGLCVVSSHIQRRYYVVYEPKTFSEALSHCREKYTDLVSVDEEEDMKLLNSEVDPSKMISTENRDQAWIGLTYDTDSWRWSLSDPSFYKQGEAEFRMWSRGEPNGPTSQLCVTLFDTGLWNDNFCFKPYPAVCCDVTGPNVTFVYVPTPMTWTKAQSYCRKHHTDLASIRNKAEHNELVKPLPSGQEVWIGLSKDLWKDLWKWSDGSQSSFRYWKVNTKNSEAKRCVAADFNSSGTWEKSSCDSKRASICYRDSSGTRKVVKVRLVSSKSTLDLNDPAVTEQILKQLKQRLEDQGLNQDIRLSWRKQEDGEVFHREEEEEDKKEDCWVNR